MKDFDEESAWIAARLRAFGDPYYIDPADQMSERISVIQTISIHPVQ